MKTYLGHINWADFSIEDYDLNEENLENAMLKSLGITKINNEYLLPNSDGTKNYIVKYVGCSDDGFGNLWECDCPAGLHGKECKHLKLIIEINNHILNERDAGW